MSANIVDDGVEKEQQQELLDQPQVVAVVAGIEPSENNNDLEKNESESILFETSVNDLAGISIGPNVPSTSRVNATSDCSSGDEGIGDMEPDNSVTMIKETVKIEPTIASPSTTEPDNNNSTSIAAVEQVPLTDIRKASDDDHHELDTLSPLMSDNHVYVDHYEHVKTCDGNILEPNEVYDDEFDLYDEDDDDDRNDDDEDFGDEEHDSVGTLIPQIPQMKHSDTKDSISSIDSDLSLSYDSGNIEPHKAKLESYLSSDDNAKDSGCDIKNMKGSSDEDQNICDTPFEIPDDDFCEKIVEQVEYYFSNDSLLRDAFLLKHVRRNKEGFVSLKLVSSFKRVRQLTKDWRVVGYAIKRKSKKIELNDLETKIRRLEPLPLYDETTPSRTVVATNLPFEKLNIERVSELFSKCGEIALVRILRPSGPIPSDVKQFINKHPELQQNECALVEFTESSAARKAQRMDNLLVYELVLPKKKTGKKASNMTKLIENLKCNTESDMERSRGGESIGLANRFKLKRNNSHHFLKSEPIYQCPPRKLSQGNEPFSSFNPYVQHNNPYPTQQYYEVPPRRLSNSIPQQDNSRKYSNCSDGYSSCSEMMSRRQSACSDISRRLSNCSDMHISPSPQSRRSSLICSEHNCPCSRRMSQYSNDSYRRISQGSMESYSPRKYSSGSSVYSDRKYSSASTSSQSDNMSRRVSFDTYDRKISTGSMTYESPMRKISTGYDPITRKLSSNSDYYVNGRKISTDSGYDRRMSINSQCDNDAPITRSRNNSLICNHQIPENVVVRNPVGPTEGSKGFGARTRKIGQVINNGPVLSTQ